jgi:predicted enzyme related to lactoylglutathione lyase
MARIIGIGGVFFKSSNPEQLYAWYEKHLGLEQTPGAGVIFRWRRGDDQDKQQMTVWSLFPRDSDYFGATSPGFMMNYIVDDLDGLLRALRAAGTLPDSQEEESEYGRFAWVTDPEGNRIELWEPPRTRDEPGPDRTG